MDLKHPNIQKLIQLVTDNPLYQRRTGDYAALQKFWSQFPKDRLDSLTMDAYVIGQGKKAESFCWWLERGLEKALGRYMPGTAKGHLIYRQLDGSLYKHRHLADLSDAEALVYVLKQQKVFATADPLKPLTWLDDRTEVLRQAGLEDRIVMGEGRRLRLISVYNPDTVLPVYSSGHIEHYLKELGLPANEIPPYNQIFARHQALFDIYSAIRTQVPQLTPFGFVQALYSDAMGLKPVKEEDKPAKVDDVEEDSALHISNHIAEPRISMNLAAEFELNQILYGPPGTGKTYETTALAVQISEPEQFQHLLETHQTPVELRKAVKALYDQLVAARRIAFTTFHQSFSYEDFIEGIRAQTDEEGGDLGYAVEDGVFKKLAILADADQHGASTQGSSIDLNGRRIWKMSLGNTLKDEDDVCQDCIDNDYIGLGYGGEINFRDCNDRVSVARRFEERTGNKPDTNAYNVTAVNTFKNLIKQGDIVVVSDGNHKFRAIAEVTGDYRYSDDEERHFRQTRPVRWLRVFETSLPKEALFRKSLSQMTVYELKPRTIKLDQLQGYLTTNVKSSAAPRNHVLIVDEINRGNIARIFGELITLLEPDKRKGGSDARTVTLPYSKEEFTVPSNLYLIGTMNTADKSLAQLDLALRRRFAFTEMLPNPALLKDIEVHGISIASLLCTINDRIAVLLDRDHLIGHSYFWPLTKPDADKEAVLAEIFANKLIPLLQEYFFANWERIRWVLNDIDKPREQQFIQLLQDDGGLANLFSSKIAAELNDRRYRINKDALGNPAAYRGILATGTP